MIRAHSLKEKLQIYFNGCECCDIWKEHVNKFNHFNPKLSYHRARDINMNQAVWFIFTKIA